YGGQGIIIPLTDLIEKNGFYIKDAFERQDGLPAGLITPDGNIYGLPNINDAFHTNYKYKAWINQHWLDALNLETPTTTEEFYNVLKAFKEQDPNGNGLADEIPMMGAYKNNTFDYDPYVFLLNAFVYFNPDTVNAGGFLEIADGKVAFVPNQEAYREGLRYVAKLISENLLDSTSLTQSEEQFKQLGTNPDAPLIGVGTTFAWWKFLAYNYETADARADFYPALAPLQGPEGVRYAPKSATPYSNTGAVITDHCADPDLAMKWLDGLYAPDVTKRSQFGIKGENWDDAPVDTLGINQEPAIWQLLKNFGNEADPASVRNVFISDRYSELRLGQMTDFSDPAALNEQEPKLYRETAEKYAPYAADDKVVPSNLYFTDAENQEYARLKEQINTYARENLVAFLTGNKNIDTDWNSYVAEFGRLDLSRYLEYVQTAYNRQYNTDTQ
ncbi:MAG TPA: hypothetical protein PKE04_02440, partial [Clostridia bacterium]|nr:hypothetical protein [Clostridia bacterium]